MRKQNTEIFVRKKRKEKKLEARDRESGRARRRRSKEGFENPSSPR